MRIVFLGSQFFNVLNYLLVLSEPDHEFSWVPLVAVRDRTMFEKRLARINGLAEMNMRIRPVFLQSPNSRLRNMLDPRILLTDFCKIVRVVAELAPDAVVVFYLLQAYPAVLLKPLFRYSLYVVATGGDVNLHPAWVHRMLRRLVCWRSDLVFAVSDDLRHKIFEESGRRPVLFPTGIDTSFFRRLEPIDELRKKWNVDQKDRVILTVSNLEKHKGVDVAIEALRLLGNSATENTRLLVVGNGSERMALRKLVMDLGLGESVHFLGEIPRESLRELYSLADVFVLSSHSEGLPFSVLEAMGCGTLCVCSRVGDIPSVIEDRYNGFLATSVSPRDFAKKLRAALTMKDDEVLTMRNNARRTVMERYDLRKIAHSMIDVISLGDRCMMRNRFADYPDNLEWGQIDAVSLCTVTRSKAHDMNIAKNAQLRNKLDSLEEE